MSCESYGHTPKRDPEDTEVTQGSAPVRAVHLILRKPGVMIAEAELEVKWVTDIITGWQGERPYVDIWAWDGEDKAPLPTRVVLPRPLNELGSSRIWHVVADAAKDMVSVVAYDSASSWRTCVWDSRLASRQCGQQKARGGQVMGEPATIQWHTGKPLTHGYYLGAWKNHGSWVVSELWFNPESVGTGWWASRGYLEQGSVGHRHGIPVEAWTHKPVWNGPEQCVT